jgi:hypothetical protein
MSKPLRFPTVEIKLAKSVVVASLALKIPQGPDLTAPLIFDTLLVDNIDSDAAPELILPAFGGPYASLVGFNAPVWVMDVNTDSLSNLQTLTYQSSRRALTLDLTYGEKALVFPAFTDVWPMTAPGTLFLPADKGYQKVTLNQLQSHGPSSGVLAAGGPQYVLIPAQWSDNSSKSGGLWMARLNSAETDLIYTYLGPINGQDIGSSGSSVIPATARSGAYIFLGQSYSNGSQRSDLIVPIKTLPDGTPLIDTGRSLQIFNDYWNIPENRAIAQQYPQVQTYDLNNPQEQSDYSHVVTAETADLNGDGLPDVISAHAYRDPSTNLMMLVPYIQMPDGTFKQEAASSFFDFEISENVPYRLFVQDLNHDGHVDLVFASQMWDSSYPTSSSAGVYLNDGLGHFVRAATDTSLIDLLQRSQVAVVESISGPQIVRINARFDLADPVAHVELLGTQLNASGPYGLDPATRGAPGFNEWFYLHQNADVATLVSAGAWATGLEHYLQVGMKEGRAAFAPGTNISGTAGIDTVIYADARRLHATKMNQDSLEVVHDSRTDHLTSIERLRFTDTFSAFDLLGNAGSTAKLLGATFGKASIANKYLVGIGLHMLDGGMSYTDLMGAVINAVLGSSASNSAVVELLYTNVIGSAPSVNDLAFFTDWLDKGIYTKASFGVLAADTELNIVNVGLVGLASTGLEYTPYVA